MTFAQAFALLTAVAAQHNGNLKEHQAIQEALQTTQVVCAEAGKKHDQKLAEEQKKQAKK